MVRCITSTRFTMLADVLSISDGDFVTVGGAPQVKHNVRQDPRTGEIIRDWVETDYDDGDNDPVTRGERVTIPCEVKAIVSRGVNAAGTTERFSGTYDNIDMVTMTFPKDAFPLSKRHRVTNVRDARTNEVIWVEEEMDSDENGRFPATEFDVLGVSPITVPMLGHTENRAILSRVDLNGE